MDIEQFRNYCLQKNGVTEELPFDESTFVFKVAGKMFALTSMNKYPFQCNLKCDPDYALELRATYTGITPGYHMNKKHWITIFADGNIPDKLFIDLINHSYHLVVKGLPKGMRMIFCGDK